MLFLAAIKCDVSAGMDGKEGGRVVSGYYAEGLKE
jgi:hypothetical protein